MSVKAVQRLFSVVAVLALVFGVFGGGQVSAQTDGPKRPQMPQFTAPVVDLSAIQPILDRGGPAKVVVILEQPSLVSLTAQAQAEGRQLAPAAAQAQLAGINQAQDVLQGQLESAAIGAQTIFRNQRVYNGIAISVDSGRLREIAGLPGVSAIVPLPTLSLDNAYATELIGASGLWDSAAAGLKYTGDGITIGVIDTGVDFIHTNFGGTGTGYEAASTATANFTTLDPAVFPTAKVVGGWDFAGDAYNANVVALSVPAPDPIPMDCNGHGSHVAGSATGLGVNADGTTFAGPYDSAIDLNAMRIGPGVAPQADLYALRVFGCTGSTDLTDMAFEWATDPNGDGDLSDHLDVVNLSLGSAFGLPGDSTTLAADAAVEAGVIVVTSSGNEGDTSFITGSPGVAQRAISVAASVDAYSLMDGFIVTAPADIAGNYGAMIASGWIPTIPAVTANVKYPGDQLGNTDGCAAFPANYFAGQIALLDWFVPFDCGSVARANNATAAGAVGVIMAFTLPVLDTAIFGSSTVPSVITTQVVGDMLRESLVAGDTVNVTLTQTLNASIKAIEPVTNDMLASFSSRGVRVDDYFLKPDLAAPGMTVFSTDTGRYWTGSGANVAYQPGNNGVSFNGTSMASPMVAGVMAILRDVHPDWTVEELKALVMNTAVHDVYVNSGQTGQIYSPTRVGAGRVDAALAAETNVILYNASAPGAVSVSFGAPEVSGVFTDTRVITVANKGTEAVSYRLSYLSVSDMPGVTLAFNSMTDTALQNITVPAGESVQFKLKLTASAIDMRNSQDPGQEASQAGTTRLWVADEGGLIKLVNLDLTDPIQLRLPVYAAPRAVSAMAADTNILSTQPNQTGSLTINLVGTGVDTTTGSYAGYPENITSLVTAFELGAESARDETQTGERVMADLQAFGVTTDFPADAPPAETAPSVLGIADSTLYFGVATYGEWTTPSQVEFDIYIDTDQDGAADYIMFNSPAVSSGDLTDVFYSFVYDVAADGTFSAYPLNLDNGTGPNTALFKNNVMVLAVDAADIGLTDADATFDYFIATYSLYDTSEEVDISEVVTYDAANPKLDLTGGTPGLPAYFDVPGNFIEVGYDLTGVNAGQSSNGLLLLHHHNANGNRVEVLLGRHSFLPVVAR